MKRAWSPMLLACLCLLLCGQLAAASRATAVQYPPHDEDRYSPDAEGDKYYPGGHGEEYAPPSGHDYDYRGNTNLHGYAVHGPPGATGDQGDQGATGANGPQGDQGATGDQGDQGDQGAAGDQGDQGDQGAAGDQGVVGDQGVTGARGATGDQGVTGPCGSACTNPTTRTNASGTFTSATNDGDQATSSRACNLGETMIGSGCKLTCVKKGAEKALITNVQGLYNSNGQVTCEMTAYKNFSTDDGCTLTATAYCCPN